MPVVTTPVPLKCSVGPLPSNLEFPPDDYRRLFLRRARLCIDGSSPSSILNGSIGLSEPVSDVGPWMNDDDSTAIADKSWKVFDSSLGKYVPAEIGFVSADGMSGTTINAQPTANRVITLPDKSGTVATVADATSSTDTHVLTGTSIAIDANVAKNFYIDLTGNTTITALSNIPDGTFVTFSASNNGTSYTLTWPTSVTVFLPSSPHSQPAAPAGAKALGIYRIHHMNTVHYIEPSAGSTGYVTGATPDPVVIPDPSPYYGSTGTILPPPKWRTPYLIP